MQRNAACGAETDLARPDIAPDVWPEADSTDVLFDEEGDSADWARTVVPPTHSVGAIGHEVGEAVFLDETDDYALSAKRVDPTSAFDLFADEEALPAKPGPVAEPAPDLASAHAPEPRPASAAEPTPAPGLVRMRELPTLFIDCRPAATAAPPENVRQPPARRVNVVGICLLVLAVGAMTTLHACQSVSVSPVALWHLIAR